MRSMRLLVVLLSLLVGAVVQATPASAATLTLPTLRGYYLVSSESLSDGVTHLQYISLVPPRVVNVALVGRDAAKRFRVVVSNERIAGGTERVSSMCARISCELAVNGDFFSTGSGQPGGGLASNGLPMRTPPSGRYHLTYDSTGVARVQRVRITTQLTAHQGDVVLPVAIDGVNVGRPPGGTILYTDQWAPTTQTGSGFEITMEPVEQGTTPEFGTPFHVRITGGFAGGSTSINPGQFVLSASGQSAALLSQLWQDVLIEKTSPEAELTFTSTPTVKTFVGGSPPLLLGGRQAFTDNKTYLFRARTARTLAGRMKTGDTIMVAVDGGTKSSVGMTMIESMRFMRAAGAVDALNLDGGGSTTFVQRGFLVNAPSTGRERGVATALALAGVA